MPPVTRAGKSSLISAKTNADTAVLLNAAELTPLWILLKQRIEATPKSTDIVEIVIPNRSLVRLDRKKIIDALLDADRAKPLIFESLSLVINEELRSDYNQLDPLYLDLESRGVLFDRMLSLTAMTIRLPDPLGGSDSVNLFEPMHRELANLFLRLISNTQTISDPKTKEQIISPRFYDANLREFAFKTLGEMVRSTTVEAGEIKELISLTRVTPADPAWLIINQTGKTRDDIRSYMLELEMTTDEARTAELEKLIQKKRADLDALNLTSVEVRDGITLKAPIRLARFGDIGTISGRLVKDNINLMDDRLSVVTKLIPELEKKLGDERDETTKAEITKKLAQLRDLSLSLARYVTFEQSFVERLFQLYRPPVN